MDFRHARARQPEIVRSVQKDANYTEELSQQLTNILRITGSQNWIRYNKICTFLAEISYHGFAVFNNLQTLGEEYTGVIQVDDDYKHIPTRLLQLTAIILEFGGESLFLRVLCKVENYINDHESIVPEAKLRLVTIARFMRSSPSYLKALHKSIFYMQADKYQISKRFTGINYVLIRHWLQPEFSLYGYKILGVITLLQVAVSLIIGSFDTWKEHHRKKYHMRVDKPIIHRRDEKLLSTVIVVSKSPCSLCLESRSNTCITPCGHLFCWSCILDWLDERTECPLCRESMQKSNVVLLKNYI